MNIDKFLIRIHQEVVWAGGEEELVRLDAAVPAHQGHVRQALRVVQAREHLQVIVPVVVKNVKKSLLQTFFAKSYYKGQISNRFV
jgi:hypothetical protein